MTDSSQRHSLQGALGVQAELKSDVRDPSVEGSSKNILQKNTNGLRRCAKANKGESLCSEYKVLCLCAESQLMAGFQTERHPLEIFIVTFSKDSGTVQKKLLEHNWLLCY